MSYAGLEQEYPRECAADDHKWNPRGDCDICGVYRDRLVKKSILVLKLYRWALTDEQREELRKLFAS